MYECVCRYQFWFLYAWIPLIVFVGIMTWIGIVRRLVNLSQNYNYSGETGTAVEEDLDLDLSNSPSGNFRKFIRGDSVDVDQDQDPEGGRANGVASGGTGPNLHLRTASPQGSPTSTSAQTRTTFMSTVYKQSAFMFGFAFITLFSFAYGIDGVLAKGNSSPG